MSEGKQKTKDKPLPEVLGINHKEMKMMAIKFSDMMLRAMKEDKVKTADLLLPALNFSSGMAVYWGLKVGIFMQKHFNIE